MIKTVYAPATIKALLTQIGLKVIAETYNDFQCYCPFHSNRYSPAMSVSKTNGAYVCFSPECGERGSLMNLLQRQGKLNQFQAMRLIANKSTYTESQFDDELNSVLAEPAPLPVFNQDTLDRLRDQFWQLPEAREYMLGRGFTDTTLEKFDVGYSVKQGLVTVPVHDPNGVPLGMVGRSITGKDFKNSPGLPKTKTIFNSHRAKRSTGVAIVTEASFDVMSIFQEGFDGGTAILGGTLSKEQIYILDRYFSKIIIMTDFDDKTKHMRTNCRTCLGKCQGHNPGRDLGAAIAKALPMKEILWAHSPTEHVYFGNVKDATDMVKSPGQIRACIENAIPNYEYALLDIY
jgi:DNA primase